MEMVQGNMLKKLFFLGIVTSSVWLGVGQAKALADEPRTNTLNFVNYRDVRDLQSPSVWGKCTGNAL